MMLSDTADLMAAVRKRRPLIHHITNYVTVNDCANTVLCAGGSPVMTDADTDVGEMVEIASALVLNIGTLNERIVGSMLKAGRAANRMDIPVILDPVGAGATGYRTETVWRILDDVRISVIKGNEGEIGFLAGAGGRVVGVDSHGMSGERADAVSSLAEQTGAIVAMTGRDDVVSDGERTIALSNGHDLMGIVSGTGCMASSVVGCYAALTDDLMRAAVSALLVFSVAGEIAAPRSSGPASFKVNLLDSLYNLTATDIMTRAAVRQL